MGTRLAAVLAALSLVVVALAAALRPDAFFAGDPGVKLIAARNALRFPTTPLAIPLPVIGTEPVPHVEPFFAVHGTHAHAVTSEFFPLATAPLLGVFGLRGLYAWPALGFVGAVAASAWLARVLDPRRDGATAALAAALGTPLLFYGLEFWEHAPAVAAGTAGAALLLDAARRRPGRHGSRGSVFAAGLLFGLAILLRPESAWFAVAVATSSRTLVHRPSWRSLLVAAGGAVAALVPLELHTVWHFRTLVPPHLAANAGLVGDGWLATRLQFAASWLIPSGWGSGGPSNAASLWSVAPAPLIAVASVLRAPEREERRFLWLLAALFGLLVLLTAPNDGGSQWGPRYLLFAYVPLSILAADVVQALLAPLAIRAPHRSRPASARATRLVIAVLLLVAALWSQRAAYRQLRGTKVTYGRLVDFVAASTVPDGQVVTDVWWLDQLGAAALGGRNVLFAGESEVGKGIVRRLHALAIPTVTIFRSREETPAMEGWDAGTCYVEESREELPVRQVLAMRLAHRCGRAQ
jgi:hypothetical protein